MTFQAPSTRSPRSCPRTCTELGAVLAMPHRSRRRPLLGNTQQDQRDRAGEAARTWNNTGPV